MSRFLFSTALLVTFSGFAWSEPLKPLVVIKSESIFQVGTFPKSGEWLALHCSKLDCEVKKATVRIVRATVDHMGDIEVESIVAKNNPLALLFGLPVRQGKVTTWFQPKNALDHQLSLQKLGIWKMPWGTTPLTISWVRLSTGGGLRYHLSDGLTKQFIFKTEYQSYADGDATPFFHWVGDLDGDGKIDFLLSILDDYCLFDYRLYLSSLANKRQFVRKAAQFAGERAACGA